jgi:hypothetical protein
MKKPGKVHTRYIYLVSLMFAMGTFAEASGPAAIEGS